MVLARCFRCGKVLFLPIGGGGDFFPLNYLNWINVFTLHLSVKAVILVTSAAYGYVGSFRVTRGRQGVCPVTECLLDSVRGSSLAVAEHWFKEAAQKSCH